MARMETIRAAVPVTEQKMMTANLPSSMMAFVWWKWRVSGVECSVLAVDGRWVDVCRCA